MTDTATLERPQAIAQDERELVLTRLIDAPREEVFDAWTNPELIKQWFAPLPWTTPFAEVDLRVGGETRTVMRSPDGQDFPNVGVFLEIERPGRLVFTDAFAGDWRPCAKPFMTVVLTFEDEGGKTRYTARARHWTVEDRERHEQMGFHGGWAMCADQLEALLKRR